MTTRDKAVDLLVALFEPPGLPENVLIDRKPFEQVIDLIIQAAREDIKFLVKSGLYDDVAVK